ncbi:Jacalin-like lectin domain-containing protein [Tirmania nivea]|nr:Jacalin-like lectin domain-containing protein [Tirmania nivea]
MASSEVATTEGIGLPSMDDIRKLLHLPRIQILNSLDTEIQLAPGGGSVGAKFPPLIKPGMIETVEFTILDLGGQGGDRFRVHIPSGAWVSAVLLGCASRLDQIQLEYKYDNGTTGFTESRGGTGGRPFTFNLEEGLFSYSECIIAVQIWADSTIDATHFKTNRGKSSDKYGGEGGNLFTLLPPRAGLALAGFRGRSGTEIDNLETIWVPTNLKTPDIDITSNGPIGGEGGDSFSDLCDLEMQDLNTAMIKSIAVRSGKRIDRIQVTYVNGPYCAAHGGGGGSPAVFTLGRGEYINRVEGRATAEIDQLQFFTNLGTAWKVQ